MAHRREVGKGAIATSLLVFVLWLSFGDALRLRSPTQKQIADESVVITLDGPVKGVLHDTHRSFQVPFPPYVTRYNYNAYPFTSCFSSASHFFRGFPSRNLQSGRFAGRLPSPSTLGNRAPLMPHVLSLFPTGLTANRRNVFFSSVQQMLDLVVLRDAFFLPTHVLFR